MSNKSLFKKIKKSIAYVSLTRFGNKILMFFFTPILVRVLGQDEYGNYATLFAVISLLFILANLGQSDAIRKYIPQIKNKTTEEQKSFFNGIIVTTLLSLVLIIVITLLIDNLSILDLLKKYKYYILGILLIRVLFKNMKAILFGLHLQNLSEPLMLSNYVIYYSSALLLAYLGYGVQGVLTGFFLGKFLVSLIMFFIVLNSIKKHFGFDFEFKLASFFKNIKKPVKSLLSFGKWVLIGVFLAQLLYQADIIMVKYFLSSKDAGLYKAALGSAQFLWIIPQIVQQALVPSFSELWEQKKINKISIISSRVLKFVFLGLILFGGGMFVLAEPFIAVYYGKGYIPAVLPMKILIIGTVGFGISRIASPIFQAANELKMNVLSSLIAVILNLGLNLYLIPKIGILGAAIGTATSYFSLLITKYFYIKKLGVRFFIDVYKFVGFLIIYISSIYLFSLCFDNNLIQIAFTAISGFVVFILLIFWIGLIDKKEMKKFY